MVSSSTRRTSSTIPFPDASNAGTEAPLVSTPDSASSAFDCPKAHSSETLPHPACATVQWRCGRSSMVEHRPSKPMMSVRSRSPAWGSMVARVSPEPQLPIQTARLRLRRLVPGDLAALHAMHSREDVTRWLFWDPRSQDEVRTSLDGHIARAARRRRRAGDRSRRRADRHRERRRRRAPPGRDRLHAPPRPPGSRLRDRGGRGDRRAGVRRVRPAPRPRQRRAAQHGVGARARAARHAQGGAPDRERVGQGRVAQRGGLRDPRSRVVLTQPVRWRRCGASRACQAGRALRRAR